MYIRKSRHHLFSPPFLANHTTPSIHRQLIISHPRVLLIYVSSNIRMTPKPPRSSLLGKEGKAAQFPLLTEEGLGVVRFYPSFVLGVIFSLQNRDLVGVILACRIRYIDKKLGGRYSLNTFTKTRLKRAKENLMTTKPPPIPGSDTLAVSVAQAIRQAGFVVASASGVRQPARLEGKILAKGIGILIERDLVFTILRWKIKIPRKAFFVGVLFFQKTPWNIHAYGPGFAHKMKILAHRLFRMLGSECDIRVQTAGQVRFEKKPPKK